jgi:hypothetical protein
MTKRDGPQHNIVPSLRQNCPDVCYYSLYSDID